MSTFSASDRPNPWPHQVTAVAAVSQLFATDDRLQIRMACGSGKTLVALEVAHVQQPGLIVWLSPTVELMLQSLRASRPYLPRHQRILVGFAPKGTMVEDTVISNDPGELAGLLHEKAMCFSTYSSFPSLVAAVAAQERPIDLIIADEAHRTSGQDGRLFSYWLRPEVPARKRLAMTATPRVVVNADGTAGSMSMDNEAVFGKVAFIYTFEQAVRDGIITGVEALIPVVEGATGMSVRAEALIAAQKEYRLKRVMTFHGTVLEAKAFAMELGKHGVHAIHVNGRMGRSAISRVRRELAGDRPVVVTNARLFGEGIDVPALDAVFFCSFKRSIVDITQQIGRAVRKSPGKTRGFLLLPPSTADDVTDIMAKGRYKELWRAVSSVLDMSANPDVRRLAALPVRVSVTGPRAETLQQVVDDQLTKLLYLRRLPLSEHGWMARASEVIDYVLAGNPPYGGDRTHAIWISDNSIALREGRLSPEQRRKFQQIADLIDKPRLENLERAQAYVLALENGNPPDNSLTILVRNNRKQPGYGALYRRMLAVRHNKALTRRRKIVAFLEAYETGVVIDRSMYAQLVRGIDDPQLSARFAELHAARLAQKELLRTERRREGIARFRAGETAEKIANDLGVTKSTIWYWERDDRAAQACKTAATSPLGKGGAKTGS